MLPTLVPFSFYRFLRGLLPMASTLRTLTFLALFAVSSATIPVEQRDPRPLNVHKSPLTRIRDSLIRTIWKVPTSHTCRHTSSHHQLDAAPTNFRARYGGDIVLRFNISSDNEVRSLAEAADMLYLDVWESSDQWVDIRMSKEIVGAKRAISSTSLTFRFRSPLYWAFSHLRYKRRTHPSCTISRKSSMNLIRQAM